MLLYNDMTARDLFLRRVTKDNLNNNNNTNLNNNLNNNNNTNNNINNNIYNNNNINNNINENNNINNENINNNNNKKELDKNLNNNLDNNNNHIKNNKNEIKEEGGREVKDTVWEYSPLVRAAVMGHIAVLDNIDRISPSSLSTLSSLIQDREVRFLFINLFIYLFI